MGVRQRSRSRRRRPARTTPPASPWAEHTAVEERLRAGRVHRHARPAAAGTRRRDRMILHLRFVEDLTQSQIAERIGVSQMHVVAADPRRTRADCARARAREALGQRAAGRGGWARAAPPADRRFSILAASAAVAVGPAAASSSITSFRTPSKNSYCAWEHLERVSAGTALRRPAAHPPGAQAERLPVRRRQFVRDESHRPRRRPVRVGLGLQPAREGDPLRQEPALRILQVQLEDERAALHQPLGPRFFLNRTSYKLF